MKEFERDAEGRVMDIEHFRDLFINQIGNIDRVQKSPNESIENIKVYYPKS